MVLNDADHITEQDRLAVALHTHGHPSGELVVVERLPGAQMSNRPEPCSHARGFCEEVVAPLARSRSLAAASSMEPFSVARFIAVPCNADMCRRPYFCPRP
jgi:hypothetical protein